MEHHSSKHRPEKIDALAAANTATKRKSFSTFLIESDFKPLVFAGRCMQYFGVGAVIGFLLGAVGVYGYAFFVKSLPLVSLASEQRPTPTPTPLPPQPKTVQLHGIVRDALGRPLNAQFWVGVFAKQLGPLQNSDGSFILEVPQSSTYDVALWTSERTVNVYTGFPAEQDGDGLRLQWALPFLQTVRTAAVQNLGAGDFRSRPQLAQSQFGEP